MMTALTYDDLFGILEECSDPEEPAGPPGDGTADEKLEELGYDSPALLDFAAVLERRFGVAIPDGEVIEARTPRALLALVNAGFAEAAPAVRARRDRGFVESRMTVPVVAEELFGLVADASRWPVLFPSTVHVRRLDKQGLTERSEVWELVGDRASTRILRRVVNADRLHIAFSWDEPRPAQDPAGQAARPSYRELAGEWRFRPLVGGATEVVLRQRYTLDEDAIADPAPAAEAVHCDSARRLAALRRIARLGRPARLLLSVSEEVSLPRPIEEVYARVHAAFGPGRGYPDESVVVAEPERWIARKTLADAPLLTRAELWSFEPVGGGTRATAVHWALIEPAAAGLPGSEADSALSGLRVRVCEELRRCTVSVLDAAWVVR
jgi:acyl carrier protein